MATCFKAMRLMRWRCWRFRVASGKAIACPSQITRSKSRVILTPRSGLPEIRHTTSPDEFPHRTNKGLVRSLNFEQEHCMYIRTNRALVWTDQVASQKGDTPPTPGARRLKPHHTTNQHSGGRPSAEPRQNQQASRQPDGVGQIRWARRAWPCAHGECVGLRQDNEGISVAVRRPHSPITWVPVFEVINSTALKRWLNQGF